MKTSSLFPRRVIPCLCCLAAAFGLLALCTKSSPLYPLNDWMDGNIFFTMGKAMMNGQVLYRDVFDHKGPLLYLIYGLGYLLAPAAFWGVYLLESLSFAVFLWFSWRTLRLFYAAASPVWVFVLGALALPTRAFSHGGSAEEFCLPFLAASLYVLLRALVTAQGGAVRFTLGQAALQGALAGCVFAIKYTAMGFYLAWVAVAAVLYLRARRPLALLRAAGAFLAGAALALAPWGLYFWLNGALPQLWQVYFYDNLFLYAGAGQSAAGALLAFVQKLWWAVHDTPAFGAAALLGAGYFAAAVRRRALSPAVPAACAALALGLAFTSFYFGRFLVYYAFVLAVFLPFALLPLLAAAGRVFARKPRLRGCCAATVPFCGPDPAKTRPHPAQLRHAGWRFLHGGQPAALLQIF